MTDLIKGTIEHVRYYNEGNQYSVLVVRPTEAPAHEIEPDGTITVVGNMPRRPRKGDVGGFGGLFLIDPKYGKQFKALEAKLKTPKKKPASSVSASSADNSDTQTTGGTPTQQSFVPEPDESDTLLGSVERVTYYNPENGWAVVKVKPSGEYPSDAKNRDGTIAVIGVMPELMQGEFAEFIGQWVMNDQYGRQFKAEQIMPSAPSSKEGVVSYIADTVFGIGDVTAGRIYDHFGAKTVEILDEDPQRIEEVGLKQNLVNNFLKVWDGNRAERRVMIQLQTWGISSRMARTIYEEYGDQTLRVIETDPYHLADDVHGIGFKRADGIAGGMGIERDAPQRLRAGLVYTLSQLAKDGHTLYPREMLLDKAYELLDVQSRDDLDLNAELNEQIMRGKLKKDTLYLDGTQGEATEAIYLPKFYFSETGAAERLRHISNTPSKIIFRTKAHEWIKYLAELAEQNNVELSDQQQSAVKAVLTDKVSVLTGGPGTGKTTTLRMVINALDEEGFSYMLASPTGRAAKRLSEATERKASTIHRMLGWSGNGGGFERDEDNPLEIDALIIDEASMIDLILFYNLLKALKPSTHLLLVGDVDQLPSVGAGNVLNDVIGSGVAHVTRLTQIFRQEDDSHIVTNAHRINQGNMPITDNHSKDFFFFNISDPEEAGAMIVEIVKERLEKKLGHYDRFHDVQVIAPMYRGAIGVNALNAALQHSLNPPTPSKAEKKFGGKIFRKGDKVMQTSNNYDKDVFNGDIGTVYAVDDDENSIHVMMDGIPVDYSYKDADEQLIHAYCISTHRSQGSEYPVVVMPLMTQHYIMLQRNLLYTAITRAKRMVVLVGTRRAMALAVNNNQVAERYTALRARLESGTDRPLDSAL